MQCGTKSLDFAPCHLQDSSKRQQMIYCRQSPNYLYPLGISKSSWRFPDEPIDTHIKQNVEVTSFLTTTT